MASVYSTSLKIELMGTGDQTGLWGGITNTNLGTALEQAIVGKATLATGDFTANVATLTLLDTNASQTARAFVLDVTATLSAAGTINVPAVQKPYIVFNNTVGGFAVTIKVAGQTGVSIPNGKRSFVYNTGTDVIEAVNYVTGTATSALTATNLTGGFAGVIPYQSAGGTTLFSAVGTAGQALLSGGTGSPTWDNVSLTTGVTGTLPIANGGTNSTATATAGGIGYGTGTALAYTPAGTSGLFLQSAGSGTPVWASILASLIRSARTSNTILGTADRSTLVDITSGTFTQTFTAAATLGSGWFCYIQNSGTGDITLDPNGSETIDGLTSYIMYPGEVRLVQCDGVALRTIVLNTFSRTFTASGTFTKPPGYSIFSGLLWGGGGGGNSTSFGGGGGACHQFLMAASAIAASQSFTIAASSTGMGNNSTFATAVGYGGDSGQASTGGGGGGVMSAGGTGDAGTYTAGNGGTPGGAVPSNTIYGSGFGGGGGSSNHGGGSGYGGGGGSGSTGVGGKSFYGGGGGAASAGKGGLSIYGGNGGDSGVSGTAPAGGGGSGATSGARGELRIWGII